MLILLGVFVVAGFVLFGGLLNAIGTSLTLVSPTITYVGSLVVLTFWAIIEALLRRKRASWVVKGGKTIKIVQPGIQVRAGILGVVLMLWTPILIRTFHLVRSPESASSVQIKTRIGDTR